MIGRLAASRWNLLRIACWAGFSAWCAAACLQAATVRAQSVWELTPYKVQLHVAFERSPELTPRRQEDFVQSLLERIDSLIGAAWEVQHADPSPALHSAMLAGLQRLTLDDLPEGVLNEFDKVVLLTVRTTLDGIEVSAREVDGRTRVWGTPVTEHALQPVGMRGASFRALVTAFAPLAKVEDVEGKQVALRARAAALPPRDETLAWLRPGDLLRPMIRYNERDGSLRRVAILEWTYLLVESVGGTDVETQIYTGLRQPLSGRRRGRVEQLALATHPPAEPTRLELRSRTDPDRPLTGYDVYAYGPNNPKSEHLGRSDRDGAVIVDTNSHPLRLVIVKSGTELLARLPLVPGIEPTLTAQLPDDSERLRAEGFIVGLQEELVDLVIRREVLLSLMRSYLADDKIEEAVKINEELNALRTRQQFAIMLDREQQKIVSSDPQVQRKIDKLFSDTKTLLNNFMRAGPVEEVQAELRAALARAPAAATDPSEGDREAARPRGSDSAAR